MCQKACIIWRIIRYGTHPPMSYSGEAYLETALQCGHSVPFSVMVPGGIIFYDQYNFFNLASHFRVLGVSCSSIVLVLLKSALDTSYACIKFINFSN